MKYDLTIDIVTDDPNNDEIVLYLVEESPWDDSPIEDRLKKIQERIYNTVDVVIDGQFSTKYPDSKGRKIRIQIDCYDPPSDQISKLVEGLSSFVKDNEEYQSAISLKGNAESIRIIYQEQKTETPNQILDPTWTTPVFEGEV
jgi:hypothetical protein